MNKTSPTPTNMLLLNGQVDGRSTEPFDYILFFRKYILNKWYWYALSLTAALALAYLYAHTAEPTYEITSKLLIRKNQSESVSYEDLLTRSLTPAAYSENVFNEIQELTSFSLIRGIVEDLQLDIQYYWEYKLSNRQGYKDFPVRVDTFALNPTLETTDFEIRPLDEQTFEFRQDKVIGSYEFDQIFTNSCGTFRIRTNGTPPLASDSTIHIVFLDARAVAENILQNLEVGFIDKNSTILQLSLVDAVPERGKDLLNDIIKRYQQLKNTENSQLALKTMEFINDRLLDISSDLTAVESSVEQFKLRNNIASETTTDLGIMLENVNKLGQEKQDIEIQLDILGAMKKDLNRTTTDFELIPANLSIANDQLQELIQPYNELVLKRRQLLVSGQPDNPVVQSTNDQLNSLKNSIHSAIDNLQNDLQLKSNMADTRYNQYSSRIRSVPVKDRQLLDKSRQQAITEKIYLYLLEKKEETAISLIGTSSNVKVIDPPRSSIDEVGPNKKVIYLGGAFAGLGLPFMLILLTDLIKDAVRTEKEIKTLLPDQTVIGWISHNRKKERQVVLRQGKELAAEQFRSLRTNLQYYQQDEPLTILVTSSVSEEGKTFIATNLAVSFALNKKKTILIDFDLRKPEVMNYMEESTSLGLSNYLEESLPAEDIIQVSKILPNLHFIAAGLINAEPLEAISDHKLAALFTYLKAHYDHIIVDTPPVGLVADAILLNKHVDQCLFVIRSRHTSRNIIEKSKRFLEQEMLPNPFLVLNDVKDVKTYGYKRYGYRRYGYGA